MLVQQVDVIGPQPPQRGIDHLADVLRPAVHASDLAGGRDVEAELRRDDDALPYRRKCLADDFLARVRAIGFGGIEERNAPVVRCADQLDRIVTIDGRTRTPGNVHTTEADCRHIERTQSSMRQLLGTPRARQC